MLVSRPRGRWAAELESRQGEPGAQVPVCVGTGGRLRTTLCRDGPAMSGRQWILREYLYIRVPLRHRACDSLTKHTAAFGPKAGRFVPGGGLWANAPGCPALLSVHGAPSLSLLQAGLGLASAAPVTTGAPDYCQLTSGPLEVQVSWWLSHQDDCGNLLTGTLLPLPILPKNPRVGQAKPEGASPTRHAPGAPWWASNSLIQGEFDIPCRTKNKRVFLLTAPLYRVGPWPSLTVHPKRNQGRDRMKPSASKPRP